MSNDWVTPQGLKIPTIEELLAGIVADQRANLEATIDTEPDQPLGQVNGIVSERLREAWEGVSIAYNADNPDAAEDFALDMVCAITGTKRGAATYSRVKMTVNLDANTTLPDTAVIASVEDSDIQFKIDAELVGVAGGNYLNVPFTCLTPGRVVANAGTLTVIQTAIPGWNTCTNPSDAIIGRDRDEDPDLRIRRLEELGGAGSGTDQAVKSGILQIQLDDESKPVIDCLVTSNESDYPDVNGVPGHALEAIIWDGEDEDAPDDDVAQAILDNKVSGIVAYGNNFGTAVDAEGLSHLVYFTRVAIIQLKITVTVVISADDPSTYAGDTAVKNTLKAIHETISRLGITELRNQRYRSAACPGVAGVLDVSNLQLGEVGDSFQANHINFQVPVRTKVLLDTTNITVVVATDTP